MCAKASMEEFEALLNESFEMDTPEEGSVVKGKVIAIEAGQAIIDVGYKMEGRVELKEFAVRPVGFSVGMHRVGVGGIVLLLGQQFFRTAFLEFDDIGFAEHRRGHDQFPRDLHLAFVVAADLGDYFWWIHWLVLYLSQNHVT